MPVAPADIAVRRAKPSDADAIADVHAAAWREAYIGILPHPTLDAMISRRGPGRWTEILAKPENFRVIEFGGKIAGYTSFGPARTKMAAVGSEIYEIYLTPAYQGVGLGRLLFCETRAVAVKTHGAGLVVWVLTQNQRALAFYRALGGRAGPRTTEHLDKSQFDKSSFLWR